MKNLYLLFFYFLQVFSLVLPNNLLKTRVTLHLEQFNKKYNLLHIGISFERDLEKIRYDYRPFCEKEGCTYETTDIDRLNPRDVFPNLEVELLNTMDIDNEIEKVNIYWGDTDKTIKEIKEFEKTLHKKYILGVNDCRHYVNKFTKWALDKPTPVWKLDKLWDDYYNIK